MTNESQKQERNKILLLDTIYNRLMTEINSRQIVLGAHDLLLGGKRYDFLYDIFKWQELSPSSLIIPVLPYRESDPNEYIYEAHKKNPLLETFALRVKGQKQMEREETVKNIEGLTLDFYDIIKCDEGTQIEKAKEYFVTSKTKLKKKFGKEWEKLEERLKN